MSDISSLGTSAMSSCVRRMKNEIRSTLGFSSSIARSARTSYDGAPATCSTRILSRMTRTTNARVLFSATASSAWTGIEISYR